MTGFIDPAVRASLIRPNSSVAAYAMAGALSKELLHDRFAGAGLGGTIRP